MLNFPNEKVLKHGIQTKGLKHQDHGVLLGVEDP